MSSWRLYAWIKFGLLVGLLTGSAYAKPAEATKRIHLTKHRAKSSSPDGRCGASITYPQIRGLADSPMEANINKYLATRWRGLQDTELTRAAADCHSIYILTTDFEALILPSAILSVKKTRSIFRANIIGQSLETECHVIDLKKGMRLDVAKWLGPQNTRTLSKQVQATLERHFNTRDLRKAGFKSPRITLAPGNFTACLGATDMTIHLSNQAYTVPDRAAVEVRIPYQNLGLRFGKSPLAKRIYAH